MDTNGYQQDARQACNLPYLAGASSSTTPASAVPGARERGREGRKKREWEREGKRERESMCVPVESSPPTERFDHRLDPLFFLFRRFLLFSANPPSALSLLSLCFICRNASNRQQRFTPTISARAHTDFLINARLCRAPGSITKLHRWRSPR